MEWYWIVAIVIGSLVVWLALSAILYKQIFKRFYDLVLSLIALIVLSPLLLILTIVDAIAMKGNPFFTQMRPGKRDKKTGQEKIFKLIKFRTMTNEKDADGNLLPDEKRLNKFGRALRQTSLDELPETLNILAGHLSIVGPRPLLVKYLPLYSDEQRRRHLVRPGLTGYAQVHGRNAISWDEKFSLDTQYVDNITFWGDIKIIFETVFAVIGHKGINSETSATMEEFKGNNISHDKNE